MSKFIFNLEALLRHREDVEQRERDELFRLTYKYQLEINHRDELTAKYQEVMKGISLKYQTNAVDSELNWFYRYLDRLTGEINECEKLILRLQSEIQAQKEVVIEASKKRKTIASLKAKREREFVAEMEKQEQKEIDDLVVTRYAITDSRLAGSADVPHAGRAGKHDR